MTKLTNSRRARKAREAEPETPSVSPRYTYVVFVYDDAEGFERTDRIWIEGVADLRTLSSVLSTEQVLAEQRGLKNIRITNWKALEG